MKVFIAICLYIVLTGCRFFQPTAQFFIINNSRDKNQVAMQVKMGCKTVFDNMITYTNVRPDLQYTPAITLPKGKYTIYANADSGKTTLQQPIMLDADRWIFISYTCEKPADSIRREVLTQNFAFDTAYVNNKLRGTPGKLSISITSEEPVHL